MPLIFRYKDNAFFFVMFDLSEPIHVHVRQGRKPAKYWVQPLSLSWNHGYRQHELHEIEQVIEANQEFMISTWLKEFHKK